jgi:hypothetical protein
MNETCDRCGCPPQAVTARVDNLRADPGLRPAAGGRDAARSEGACRARSQGCAEPLDLLIITYTMTDMFWGDGPWIVLRELV